MYMYIYNHTFANAHIHVHIRICLHVQQVGVWFNMSHNYVTCFIVVEHF